jgi:uncharacterized membrane protein YsdA (DUF1294 family)
MEPWRRKQRAHPVVFHATVGLAVALGMTGVLWAVFGRPGSEWTWIAFWLAGINLTTFLYYGYDKACARLARRRVPERVLHGLALVGGSVGALAAMRLFRHKTIKSGFRIVFWLIVAAQLLLLAWLIARSFRITADGSAGTTRPQGGPEAITVE